MKKRHFNRIKYPSTHLIEKEVFRLLNRKRNPQRLEKNYSMVKIAREHSHVMVRKKRIFHSNGKFPENVAFVPTKTRSAKRVAKNIHRVWMDSHPHANNRMNSNWNSYGIGIARKGSHYYATEIFSPAGAPMSLKEILVLAFIIMIFICLGLNYLGVI